MTPTPTGRRLDRDGRTYVEFTRTFRAPIDDVWAAVTEPDRLARWIGTWTGDPASGAVQFQMTYEGDGVPSEAFTIDECEPPVQLRITTSSSMEDGTTESWRLRLDLAETDGITTLIFAQDLPDPAIAENVGPGWDYYLDRMQVAESGGDPATLVWDDYFPALTGHYRAEFG
ncbi:SRPBCC family protein [Nocardioides marmoriginsengisoli]|uniref:SRPBCC family protein n=1 Tax=Nocardioides marmoriginsengisoli TaxID=661483 RepID=A0A3N0CCS7_9ACTN|nr:SRPBCC family protein [Nocardioides marmoriginsengisoli]RNL61257.1 SRPBCC family protein [Nocardioides marmoriginsengisoli]